ncbi:unnamed protein product [Adineta ricciae]|uniref:Uncharacterized protein n=1 Tax=Adineta ricciae TaxID=249248 RepID=A0A815M6Y8_ADIRI|nr:unnamed protein product [Adineta ricciae]
MQCASVVFVLVLSLTLIGTIITSDPIDDVQDEVKSDEPRQVPVLVSPFRKQTSMPECLSKTQLLNMLNRDRRASISRPYFHYWRSARDNGRYSLKSSLAFSPRLGKRSTSGEQEADHSDNKLAYRSADLDALLLTLIGHLQGKNIDIVYEDSTKICLSQSISDVLIQQVLDKFDTHRRDQNTQDKESSHNRQSSSSKHPILFRYRLG